MQQCMRKTIGAGLLALGTAANTQAALSTSAELGATLTSGNTESTNVLAKIHTNQTMGDWQNSYKLQALYAEDSGVRSAERYFAEWQIDYPATGRHYFFGVLNGQIDKFSGYDYIANVALGAGYKLIDTPTQRFKVEGGPGYSYKKLDKAISPDGGSEANAIVRVKAEYWWQFSKNAEFKQIVGSDIGIDGPIISYSETALTANLIGELALKLSYTLEHNSEPVSGTKSTDTVLAATVLYQF